MDELLGYCIDNNIRIMIDPIDKYYEVKIRMVNLSTTKEYTHTISYDEFINVRDSKRISTYILDLIREELK